MTARIGSSIRRNHDTAYRQARRWLLTKIRSSEVAAELVDDKDAAIAALEAAGITTVDVTLDTGDVYSVTLVAPDAAAAGYDVDELRTGKHLTPRQKAICFPEVITRPFDPAALAELVRQGKLVDEQLPRRPRADPPAKYLKPTIKRNPKAAGALAKN